MSELHRRKPETIKSTESGGRTFYGYAIVGENNKIVTKYEFNYRDQFYFDPSIYNNATGKKHLIKEAEVKYTVKKDHTEFGRSLSGVVVPIAYMGEYFPETAVDKDYGLINGSMKIKTYMRFKGILRVEEAKMQKVNNAMETTVFKEYAVLGYANYSGDPRPWSDNNVFEFKEKSSAENGGLEIDEECTLSQTGQIVYIHTPTLHCAIQGTLRCKSLKITK